MGTPTSKVGLVTRERRCVLALLIGLIGVLGGCNVREVVQPVGIELLAVTPVNARIVKQKLELSVVLRNPGLDSRQLAHLFYWLELDGEAFVEGRVQGLRILVPGKKLLLRLQVITGLSGLGRLLAARRHGYIVHGDSLGRAPFEQRGAVVDLDLTRPRRLAKVKG